MSDNKTCSKRVIIHPGVDLTIGVSAALTFDKEYVVTGKGPTGLYHSRTYTGLISTTVLNQPVTEEIPVSVYHSETSIIVRLADPIPEPNINDDLANLMPKPMFEDAVKVPNS